MHSAHVQNSSGNIRVTLLSTAKVTVLKFAENDGDLEIRGED
jgi:hypothetical protein